MKDGGRMMAAVHYIKFMARLLIFIVLLPVFLLWAYIRQRVFKRALINSLQSAGMSDEHATRLAREAGIGRLLKNSNVARE